MAETKGMSKHSLQKMPLFTMALLCFWPFASFLNSNQDDALIYGTQILAYGLALLITSGALLWGMCICLGRRSMSAVAHIIGVGCVCFFLYLPLSNLLAHLGVSLGVLRLLAWLPHLSRCLTTMEMSEGAAAIIRQPLQ